MCSKYDRYKQEAINTKVRQTRLASSIRFTYHGLYPWFGTIPGSHDPLYCTPFLAWYYTHSYPENRLRLNSIDTISAVVHYCSAA